MSSYSYVGGQHLYPSAKKKKVFATNPYGTKATQTGSGTFAGIGSLWEAVGGRNPTNPSYGGSTVAAPPRGGGRTNPYAELINNMLNQTRADTAAESVADAAGRDAAIRRLLISFGETPDLASLGISQEASGVLGGVMDERTRALAAQNTAEGTSVKARIEAANKIAQREIPANLASRGTFRSGQTGYALGQQALQHKQTTFDTLNEMLGNVEGAVGSFAANERARQRALAEAENDAAWRLATEWDDTSFDDPIIERGPGGEPQPPTSGAAAATGMLSRSRWLAMHPGGNYENYVRAWKARNPPIYMGGAYRY